MMTRLYAQRALDWKLWTRGRPFWIVMAMLVLVTTSSWAQEKAQIQGVVQQGDNGIADHRIMLIRFGPGPQDVNRTPGQTDASGRFTFDGLETAPGLSYVVGIRYDNQLYRSSSVVLEPGQVLTDVVLEVGAEGTRATEGPAPSGPKAPDGVHIGQRVVAVALREGHLEVREILGLRHPGSEPYEGPSEKGKSSYVLHFPLPEGYYNVRGLQGLDEAHMRSDPAGLFYTAPLPPGVHRVMYSYALPMPDAVTTLMFRRTLPTMVFDIFVDGEALVATSEVQYMGRAPIESHEFLHFRGVNLEPSSRSWLQVTHLATGATGWLRAGSYSVIIGLGLLGLLIPIYRVWKQRQSSVQLSVITPEQVRQWQTDREGLVQRIAQLDDERAAGTLSEQDHRQQRRGAKQELLEVASQLRMAESGPRNPSVGLAERTT